MKKNISAAALAAFLFLSAVMLSGCGKSGGETKITQVAQSFVTSVRQIETPITIASGQKIDAAYLIYEILNEKERNFPEVADSKTVLDGYKKEFDVIKAAADEREELEKEAARVEAFLKACAELPDAESVTLDDREAVDGALALYAPLNEQSRQDTNVAKAYEQLSACDERITALENAAHEQEVAETASAFIQSVEEIGEVTLDSIDAIEDLLYDYEYFTQEVKDYEGVAEAKAALDGAYARYLLLKDESDVRAYLDMVEKLKPVETAITLQSEGDIEDAEVAYEELSETAKGFDGVSDAKAVVELARQKYDALFAVAEEERVKEFIAAAEKVGTDLENVDITWYEVLHRASVAYSALTLDSQEREDVRAAFDRWNAAQTVFDQKGYRQIPMVDPNILFSGHAVNPIIVLQMEENMLRPVREFYGVSSNGELAQKIKVWLNVYVGDEYVSRAELPVSSLGHEIASDLVIGCLKEIAANNPSVTSGTKFKFSIYFEDREGVDVIPSNPTKISAEKPYTW